MSKEIDFRQVLHLIDSMVKAVEQLVLGYLKKYRMNSEITENMLTARVERLSGSVLTYMMVATRQDLFISELVSPSKNLTEVKQDLIEIQKTADRLLVLLECTEAGKTVTNDPKTKRPARFLGGHVSLLSAISAISESKLDELKPVGRGRLASPEREWRVGLVHKIMQLAKSVDAPCGTGCTGVFHDLILDVYAVLNLKTSNIGRDLRDARRLQLDTAKPDLN